MIKIARVFVVAFAGMLSLSVAAEQNELPQDLVKSLELLGQNPALLKVINRHNLKVINMNQIKLRNEMWKSSPKGRILKNAALRNPASVTLKEFAASMPYLEQVSLMDRRGINIAMNAPAEAYWVGDQDEWVQPITTGERYVTLNEGEEGKGLVKVSTPILSDGRAVGVLMVSLDATAL